MRSTVHKAVAALNQELVAQRLPQVKVTQVVLDHLLHAQAAAAVKVRRVIQDLQTAMAVLV